MRALALLSVAAACLVMAPSGLATQASGTLATTGPLVVGGAHEGSGALLATFIADSSRLTKFTVTSPWMSITRYDAENAILDAPTGQVATRTMINEATFDLHDVTLTLVPTTSGGWLGIDGSSTRLEYTARDGATWTPSTGETLGNGAAKDSDDAPIFHHETHEASLGSEMASFTLAGAARLKWSGPTVHVKSQENETDWKSGSSRDASPVPKRTDTWYIVKVEQATIVLAGAPARVETGAIDVRHASTLSFEYASGALDAPGARLSATPGDRVVLQGTIDARVSPNASPGTDLAVSGDVTSSSLVRVQPVPGSVPLAIPLVIGLAACAAAGTAGLWWGRRNGPARVRDLDELRILADASAEVEDYDKALKFVQEARARAPGSIRLALDEAFYHEQLGSIATALATLTGIAPHDASGDADYHAARIMSEHRFDDDKASDHLVRALDKASIHLLEAEDDPSLRRLLSRPNLARAVRDANRRVDEPPT